MADSASYGDFFEAIFGAVGIGIALLKKKRSECLITNCAVHRTPLNGLPDALKVRGRNRKVSVSYNPRSSYLRAGVKDLDLTSLSPLLIQSLTPRLKGRSRMSSKYHLQQVRVDRFFFSLVLFAFSILTYYSMSYYSISYHFVAAVG